MKNWRITLLLSSMTVGCAPVPEPLDNAPSYPIQDTVLHATVKTYCIDCHKPEKMEGDIDLASILDGTLNDEPYVWQDVAWVIQNQEMPPIDDKDAPRPDQATYQATSEWLKERLGSGQHSQLVLNSEQPDQAMLETYCLNCHNDKTQKGEVNLSQLVNSDISEHPAMWEKALRKINSQQMPPKDRKRPNTETYQHLSKFIAHELDKHSLENQKIAQIETFRRLSRTEYKQAIKDLLNINVDVTQLLPADQESFGFDNTNTSNLNATLLERYINAAQKISAQVVGVNDMAPDGKNYRNKPDHSQENHIQGLPLGTVGGIVVDHHFPVAGEYRIDVRLSRDRDEKVEGLNQTQTLEILLNDKLEKAITIQPPKGGNQTYHFDESHLFAHVNVTAGSHKVGVTFPRLNDSIPITKRKPYNAAFNLHRHPRRTPGIYEISVTGPYVVSANQDNSQFTCNIQSDISPQDCARQVLTNLATKAYRKPVSKKELDQLMHFFNMGYKQSNYQEAIQKSVAAVLVNPNFLFKIETPTPDSHQDIVQISDYQLASRLAFFLWNSLPDEELLTLAKTKQLQQPDILSAQVQRMLKDTRTQSMLNDFTEQWLHLRNIDSFTPDVRRYPDFDNNLRQDMKQETLLFVSDVLLSDKNVTELLNADYTFLNERMAKHYDIPQVYGSRFRKVSFPETSHRGGLLRQSSVLTVTSYANRTSPVLRGNWVLENILGTPTPPPPPDIPSLDNAEVSESLPIRQRLAKHREDPACASCHNLMDPVGYAFENFDAVGQWRDTELNHPVDASGGLPDGASFIGAQGLVDGLMTKPELFVQTFTEKLMTYALGRGLDYTDAPSIRKIVNQAKQQDYSFSSIATALVLSPQFRYKSTENNQLAWVESIHKGSAH